MLSTEVPDSTLTNACAPPCQSSSKLSSSRTAQRGSAFGAFSSDRPVGNLSGTGPRHRSRQRGASGSANMIASRTGGVRSIRSSTIGHVSPSTGSVSNISDIGTSINPSTRSRQRRHGPNQLARTVPVTDMPRVIASTTRSTSATESTTPTSPTAVAPSSARATTSRRLVAMSLDRDDVDDQLLRRIQSSSWSNRSSAGSTSAGACATPEPEVRDPCRRSRPDPTVRRVLWRITSNPPSF